MACRNYNPLSFPRMLFFIVYLTVYFHVSFALTFTSEPSSQDVKQGDQANFHCVVDDPEITVTWTLNNVTIFYTSRRYVDDDYLTINEVQRNADAGEFVCVAKDTVTEEVIRSAPASLNIKWISDTGKVLLKGPADLSEVVEGGKVTLLCKIDGNPSPTLSWYRDGRSLAIIDNYEMNGARLKIKSMTPDDNGEYACRGINRLGEAWSVEANVTLLIEDTRKAKVMLVPSDVVVVRGEKALFDCSCTGDEPTLTWYFQEFGAEMPRTDALTNNSRQSILLNSSLHIDQVKRTQAGTYVCTCSNERATSSAQAILTVANIDNMQNFDDGFVNIGSPLSVNCTFPENEAGGVPLPEPEWSVDGSPLTTSGNVKQTNSFLIIDSVTEADYGIYECTMTNMAGQKQASVDVRQPTKPKITTKPETQVLKEGQALFSHCIAEGSPTPTINWLRNGIDVTKMEDGYRFNVFANGTLHIFPLKMVDSSSYTCKASSLGGTDKFGVDITVKEMLKFRHWQQWKQMEVGDPSRLTCSTRGGQNVVVIWFKEMGALPSGVYQVNNTLIFKNPTQSESGNYMCVASNANEIINNSVSVNVRIHPKFTVLPGNVTGYMGRMLIIHCQATGDPEPKITWMNLPVDSTTFPNGTLVISSVGPKDEGVYACVAGSIAGLNTTYLNLVVSRTRPPAEVGLMTRTILIAVGCAVSYILLVVGLMCYCRHRRLKMNRNYDEDNEKTNGMLANHDQKEVNGQVVKDGEMVMNPVYPGRRGSYDNLLFPKHDLQKLSVLGKGRFGEVFLARAVGIKDGEEVTTVIVKALNEKEETIQLEFRKEIEMLSKVDHDNIVKLLGICREGEIQFMITEYLDWGDLKNYLIATQGKNGHTNSPPQLTLTQKIDVINQVAQGMEHLANNRFTHGDLASHNCLLSPSMEIKITTISVSQDLFRTDYHEYHQRLLPIRWMSPEAIYEDDFSTKSDVWSFGVLIWEVFSSGELPYKDKENEDILKAIVDGDLMLDTPQGTPDEIEILMHRCWSNSPADRPSFGEIMQTIGELSTDSQI